MTSNISKNVNIYHDHEKIEKEKNALLSLVHISSEFNENEWILNNSREWNCYQISPGNKETKVMVAEGIFNQKKEHIFIDAITDVDLKQSYLERILNYGKLHVRSSSWMVTLEMNDIGKPQEAMEVLENLIEKYKKLRVST